jgi:outer membrane protein TolC
MLAAPPAFAQALGGPDSLRAARVMELVRMANPELEARTAALVAAEARVPAAGTVGPATLSVELEEVPDGFDVGDAGSLRLDLSRELFGGGRRAASRAVARQAAERARLELALVERSLRATTEALLVRHLGALAIAERLAGQDSLLAGAEDAIRTRFAVGEARYVDVLRLRTERLRTSAELAQVRSEAAGSRIALIALAGASDTASRELAGELDRLESGALAGLDAFVFPESPAVDSLLAASAAVRLADAEVVAAESRLGLTVAEQRTRMSASVGVQRFGADDTGHRVGPTLGASMTLPFTAHGASRARRFAAERDVAAAQADRRAVALSTKAELEVARARYEAAVANAALFETALLRGAREERENALASYRTGAVSLLELLDFEHALAQSEISRSRSRMAAAEAYADLVAGAARVTEHTPSAPAFSGGDL